ncbi:SDR family NAD(P)-dependent oxidoreductase, partial [Streptomyces rimosus]
MHIDLSGRTAVVTGSSQGIGHAIATGLARAGAGVVLTGRDTGRLDTAAGQLREAVPGAEVSGVTADLATESGARDLLSA